MKYRRAVSKSPLAWNSLPFSNNPIASSILVDAAEEVALATPSSSKARQDELLIRRYSQAGTRERESRKLRLLVLGAEKLRVLRLVIGDLSGEHEHERGMAGGALELAAIDGLAVPCFPGREREYSASPLIFVG